ncbi:MAG TPA: DinB family protein [Gemmatimonadales bacterium]|nr:DinB family protein [Gemmatimonadales bacterium]
MSQLSVLIETNCALLRQGQQAMAIEAGALYRPDPSSGTGSVGAHFRHVLEHYSSFFAGLATGRIDYDARARDASLESDPALAAAALEQIIEQLQRCPPALAGQPLQVNVAVATSGHGRPQWSDSTVARELAFLLSHTVHHYALIALHARQRGIELGEEFGVAPSTIEYRSTQLTASR